MSEKLITTCTGDGHEHDYAGHCPCCHTAVYYSQEDESEYGGPVWTCPADLSENNPHHEDHDPDREITEEMREEASVYSNCWEDYGGECFDMMPLHGACYGGERPY